MPNHWLGDILCGNTQSVRGSVSVSNGKNIRCHEAIQIYTLVEVDVERQIIEKTEFLLEKGCRFVGK